MNIDKYTKIILTIIALNTTLIVGDSLLGKLIPDVWAQGTMNVYVEGGSLDYETDITSGPTLKVCLEC